MRMLKAAGIESKSQRFERLLDSLYTTKGKEIARLMAMGKGIIDAPDQTSILDWDRVLSRVLREGTEPESLEVMAPHAYDADSGPGNTLWDKTDNLEAKIQYCESVGMFFTVAALVRGKDLERAKAINELANLLDPLRA